MTAIGFYHLQRMGLERALPKLLEKALERELKVVVLAGSEERVEALNRALWTYAQRSFLPHGSAGDGFAEQQPVYLTAVEENPNGATVLALVDGVDPAFVGDFARCLDLFDGNDEAAVAAARRRWKAWSEAGHEVAYWQQTAQGGWEQKA